MEEKNTEITVAPDKPKFKKKENLTILIISSVLSLAIGLTSGFICLKHYISKIPEPQQSGVINQNPTNITIQVDEKSNSNIEAIAKKVSPCVVFVRTSEAVDAFFGGNNESAGEGSGVIYSEDGYIITNYSVIKKATENANMNIEVFFSGNKKKPLEAEIVGYNISYDLAVLKVDATGLIPIEIADVKNLAVGQYAVAIGSPGGIDYMGTVTYGIISGVKRTAGTSASNETALSLIQTDAIIGSNFTGGALVNIKGQLIGVPSSKIVAENVNGMGFAIPADKVIEVCEKVIDKGETPDPYIGVTFSDSWTAERLTEYGYPAGAVVGNIVEGGPAQIAGIKNGDIITEFGGTVIEDYSALRNLISECKPGDTVSVKFYRSGRYYNTAVTVGSNNAQ